MLRDTPHERCAGKPSIGSNRVNLIESREGDDTAMLVEGYGPYLTAKAVVRRDMMALGRECLQSFVDGISDDDAAMVVDTHSLRCLELTSLLAPRAEREQERAIDRREHLYSMVARVHDRDSISNLIECDSGRILELTCSGAVVADLEQQPNNRCSFVSQMKIRRRRGSRSTVTPRELPNVMPLAFLHSFVSMCSDCSEKGRMLKLRLSMRKIRSRLWSIAT